MHNKIGYCYALVRIAGCPTPNSLLRIIGFPTPNGRESYSERSTPYKCALLCIDTIRSPVSHKNPTPVGAH